MSDPRPSFQFKYHHLQMFVDQLKPTQEYKVMESRLNEFAKSYGGDKIQRLEEILEMRKAWQSTAQENGDPSGFVSAGRDLVSQLLHGIGWRVVGAHEGGNSLCMCSLGGSPGCSIYLDL